jgi:hypothetical protein
MMVIMPAPDAARTPLWESSSARQRAGSTPSRSAGFRKGVGIWLAAHIVALRNDSFGIGRANHTQ